LTGGVPVALVKRRRLGRLKTNVLGKRQLKNQFRDKPEHGPKGCGRAGGRD